MKKILIPLIAVVCFYLVLVDSKTVEFNRVVQNRQGVEYIQHRTEFCWERLLPYLRKVSSGLFSDFTSRARALRRRLGLAPSS